MVGIVLVSHSAQLADGVVELAREMAGPEVALVAAGGLDQPGRPLGTDAVLIAGAIERAWDDAGVLILMDLGSAVLSAELAAEMLPDERRSRVLLCEAPLVEGAVAAAVAARLGDPLDQVAAEARGGLAGKAAHLGAPAPPPVPAAPDGNAGPDGDRAGDGTLELRLAVRNPLGLHARPAARFVQTAGQFDAAVTAENLSTHAGPASARSLNGIATLGVLRGHEVLVRATGPQAAEAISALRDLAGRDFDEPLTAEPLAAEPPSVQAAGEPAAGEPLPGGGTVLSGIPGSPGIAAAGAVRLRPVKLEVPREPGAGAAAELARLDAALEATRKQVQAARDRIAARPGRSYEAGIFDAHLLFLADDALLSPARRRIGEGRNAADAWDSAVAGAVASWQSLTDPYQRERVRDLESIRSQVLANLLGAGGDSTPRTELTGTGIVVAAEVTPADTASFDPAVVSGIATAFGGPTAHAAILARALGIPAVLGLGPAVLSIPEGTPLLLDGDRGMLAVAPGEAALEAARQASGRTGRAAALAGELAAGPAVTVDGTLVEVAANAGSADDVRRAVAAGADGIGLLRTEFVFLTATSLPTEAEQEAVYSGIARLLGGRPLIIRTLDVGADKPLPYLPREAEANPALGQRGLRLGLARPDLLRTQVRAILRVAARHPVKLMFPMVTTAGEARSALDLVSSERRSLAADGVAVPATGAMETGIMIEVPAAALTAARLADTVDFFSVGTNDLTQYTMAVDRELSSVAGLGDAIHPAVLTLIGAAASAAADAGRWTGVCGELAADPLAVPLLLGLGVRELSVNAASVGIVKQAVRATDLGAARELARQAIRLPSAEAVRELVRRHGTALPPR
ncbi:MAG TPA: phosphoenolpyruvate--protein phosphotransferase [Trebonia sp.]|nr:phosphoenolpyruvate--protein phosphotransferase [Trebonia sp.]